MPPVKAPNHAPRYLAMHGAQLLVNQFQIIPITPGYKFPRGLDGWQTLNATQPQLNAWLANGRANDGVGILTAYTPAVDIDVYDASVAEAMTDWVDTHIGTGKLRVGQAPKRMLVFKTDTPFSKVFSNTYLDKAGNRNRVEILGDGQQFVAYAIHPDTNAPYEWVEGDLLGTSREQLDSLSRDQAQRICHTFEALASALVSNGVWTYCAPGNASQTGAVSTPNQLGSGVDPLDVKLPLPDIDLARAEEILFSPAILPLVDATNDDWVRVGQALHHQFNGEYDALLLWDRWSSNGQSYEGFDAVSKRWDSFGRKSLSERAITFRSYLGIYNAANRAVADAAGIEQRANESFLLETLKADISAFDGDWFDFKSSPVLARARNFLSASQDSERHSAALLAAIKARSLDGVSGVAEIRKAIKVRSNPASDARTAVQQSGNTGTLAISSAVVPDYQYDDKGNIMPTQSNVVQAVGQGEAGQFAYDEFLGQIVTSANGQAWAPLTDDDYTRTMIALEQRGFSFPPKEKIKDGISIAAKTKSVDMAIAWGNGLVWDGTPRLYNFGTRYLHLADTPYHRAVWVYVWTALAGRVMEPGTKADMVPILISKEGLRKSTLVEALAPIPESFGMLDLSRKDDDISRAMRGKIVLEWAEMKGLKGRDEESIKAFVTQPFQEWVPKYKEMPVRYARRCFFIATANDRTPLPVNGEARRWLPMIVDRSIDVQGVKDDLTQLWAEAVLLFKQRGVLWQDASDLAPTERVSFREEDELGQFAEAWLDAMSLTVPGLTNGQTPFRIAEIIAALEFAGRRNVTARKLGPSLRTLGYDNVPAYYGDIKAMDRRWHKVS